MEVDDPRGNPMEAIKFLKSMTPEELEPYKGEWVAVVNKEIVAHGKDPELVHKVACEAGKGEPFMESIYMDYADMPRVYYAPRG